MWHGMYGDPETSSKQIISTVRLLPSNLTASFFVGGLMHTVQVRPPLQLLFESIC